jgi:hypothetical protein
MRHHIKATMYLGESEEVAYNPEVECLIFYDTIEVIHALPEDAPINGTMMMTKGGVQYTFTTPFQEIIEQIEQIKSTRHIFVN